MQNSASSSSASSALGTLPEWDLSDFYQGVDDPALADDMKKAQSLVDDFSKDYKGKLGGIVESNSSSFLEAIKTFEVLHDLLGRLSSYASLLYAGNTADPAGAKFYGDMNERLTAISSELLFFTLELNQIDEDVIAKALSGSAALQSYAPWLKDVRMDKPYQLEDRVEALFHDKSVTGAGAFNRLFDETMTGLRFDVGGDALALEQTLNLLVDNDGAKRKAASAALAHTFKSNERLFTLITNTLAKDKEISDRWRGFKDVADSRHLANRVEGEVVDALVEAVRASYPKLSHRYYGLKAKWMGKDVLDHWDRNAPLPHSSQRLVPWDEARETILSAYGAFDPEMRKVADTFFEKNWIDAPVREGKAPGAFSHPTVPSVHPYVLMNYQGKVRDVMTLAHELGHGVHQVLAGEQGALMAPTPLTLAETASVFGEMLTFRSLLDKVENVEERKVMLAGKVEDMLNTVVRQIAFYQFERQVHEARRDGELTSERIGDIWMDVQREALGPSVRLGAGYETFWMYIPHFIHAPFYVYAYAFGDCLVNSLYGVYEKAESGFQDKYFDMLKAGGTKHHSELLAPFGLDASNPSFWSIGLSLLEGFIDELEALG